MSAYLLRQAATILRDRAGRATPGAWEPRVGFYGSSVHGEREVVPVIRDADAGYIATMHPNLGLALADWLEWEFSHDFGPSEHAINVARLIVGGDA